MKTFWKIARWSAVGVLILAGLAVLFGLEENWRGHRAWAQYRSELEEAGFRFGPEVLRGPAFADADNFAKEPLLLPLFQYERDPETGRNQLKDESALHNVAPSYAELERWRAPTRWKTGVATSFTPPQAEEMLHRLAPFTAKLQAIAAAAQQRPLVQYPLPYEEGLWVQFPQIMVLSRLGGSFNLRAAAELALGKNDAAFSDVQTSLRLSHLLALPPLVLVHTVRVSAFSAALNQIWSGMNSHRWTEPQLEWLEQDLGETHFLAELEAAVRGEMAMMPLYMENITQAWRAQVREQHLLTNGWRLPGTIFDLLRAPGWRDRKLVEQLRWDRQLLSAIDAPSDRIFPRRLEEQQRASPLSPLQFSDQMTFAIAPSSLRGSAYLAQAVGFARLGCALERYWLQEGAYPPALEDLSPGLIAKVPHDVCTGASLHYRRENGGYRFWSVGWDLQDDHGKIALRGSKDVSINYESGNWVWLMPGMAGAK